MISHPNLLKSKTNRYTTGFTIIEILISIALFGVLAVVTFSLLTGIFRNNDAGDKNLQVSTTAQKSMEEVEELILSRDDGETSSAVYYNEKVLPKLDQIAQEIEASSQTEFGNKGETTFICTPVDLFGNPMTGKTCADEVKIRRLTISRTLLVGEDGHTIAGTGRDGVFKITRDVVSNS